MQVAEERPLHHADTYRDFRDAAVLAEELGFHSIWTSEHHFLDDGYCPSLPLLLGAAAGVTGRIRLGTGALILTLHEPDVLVAQVQELRRLAGDRVDLGVAVGYRPSEFSGLGFDWRGRRTRFLEAFDLVQAALGMPLWAVSATPGGGRRAAAHGANLLLSPALTDAAAAEVMGSYRTAGGSGEVALIRDVWVDEGTAGSASGASGATDAAWQVVHHLNRLYAVQYASWGFLRDERGTVTPKDPHRVRAVVEQMARTALLGSLERVRAGCDALAAAGLDVLVLRVQWGWLGRKHVMGQIERLGSIVGARAVR